MELVHRERMGEGAAEKQTEADKEIARVREREEHKGYSGSDGKECR